MASNPSRRLEDLSGPEIAERITESSVIVQPIGAVEQHGPHLPLSVDHVIAHESAAALVAEHGDACDLWLLPTLSVSKSNEHAWSPGTLWLSAETLLAVLHDIGRSVATTRARRLVFLNGHGGNSALLNVACREIRLAHGLMTFLVHPFVPPDHGGTSPETELGMGIHGGHRETSVFMHLRPHLVHLERARRAVPERLADNRHVRFRRADILRLALQRLRARRSHRRPDGSRRRGGQAALRDRSGPARRADGRDRRLQLRPRPRLRTCPDAGRTGERTPVPL